MNNIIEDLKLVYDPENKSYVKAYAKIDGKKIIVEDVKEINKLVSELKVQKGVTYLKEIPNDYSLAFVNNEKAIAMFEEKYSDVMTRKDEIVEEELLLPAVLNEVSPYDGLVATGIDRSKLKKFALGAAGFVVLTGVALAGCKLYNSRAKEEPEAIVLEKVEAKEITKENPKTWEEYVSDYSESMQKVLLTDEMEEITYIHENDIYTRMSFEVEEMKVDKIVKEILSKIKTKYVHISFDLDVIKPNEFPAVNVGVFLAVAMHFCTGM